MSLLSPGEISVGMHITILEWEPIVHEADGFFTQTCTVTQDRSWCGDVLKVTAVQLPFVVVDEGRGGFGLRGINLDTRHVKLMELKPEYVAARTQKTE